MALHSFDLLILIAYLAIAVAIGIRIGAKPTGLEGYLLGNRTMPWWAILGSIVATETSTATFLSIPGVAFAKGGDFRFLQLAAGFVAGRAIIVAVLLPRFFDGKLLTAYQLLGVRYGRSVQHAASCLFLVTRNLGDGLRLFLAALVLKQILSIDFSVCVMVVGTVTIGYTLLGGMKSVVWNDCIQFVIYVVGAVVALAFLVRGLPEGWQSIIEYGRTNGKFQVLDWSLDVRETFSFWAGLIGGVFLSLGTHGTDQMMVQRLLGAGSVRNASKALLASGIVVFIQFALFLLIGVALACFYDQFPPLRPFGSNDEVFARFIVDELPAGWGLIGLILAAVFAAAMSTLSSSLNASASSVVGDFLRPRLADRVTDQQYVRVSQAFTLVFGILQMAIAIGAFHISRSVVNEALAIAGFSAGILLGVFGLAIMRTELRPSAGLAGMAAGCCVVSTVHFATDIAWTWYAVIGAVSTATVGAVVAAFTATNNSCEDPTNDVTT